jgi:phosphoglycolate phosphatase-like HAD superfamily hydrolase
VGGSARILVAPDPKSLAKIIPKDFLEKAAQAGVFLIVDADGTLIDLIPTLCSWLGRELGCVVIPSDVREYDFSNIHPNALGIFQERVFSNAEIYWELPLTPGAKEMVGWVVSRSVPLLVLTSRPATEPGDPLVEVTVASLREHEIPFDLLIFSQDKGEVIEALQECLGRGVVVVVVDDDPKVIAAVSRLEGVVAVIFTTSYNLNLRLSGTYRAGKYPDDPDKWKVVRQLVKGGLKGR